MKSRSDLDDDALIDAMRARLNAAEVAQAAVELEVERWRAALAALGEESADVPVPPLRVVTKQLEKPRVSPNHPTKRAVRSKPDLAEVARIACEAQRQGRPFGKAVSASFGCSSGRASQLVSEARVAGFDVPIGVNSRQPTPPSDADADAAPAPTSGNREPWTPDTALKVLEGGSS